MKIIISILLFSLVYGQGRTPSDYWGSLNESEKVSFVNGAYAAASDLKMHHQRQVKEQYIGNDNWVRPYYIDRFYEIVDEHISKEVEGNIDIIAKAIDAFYSNSDNANIPVMEAVRIVSMVQDGKNQKANLHLLKAQRKYGQ
ncbi:MAG: hypothetical protein ACE5D0_09735 [Fidelibacterota bacterium]